MKKSVFLGAAVLVVLGALGLLGPVSVSAPVALALGIALALVELTAFDGAAKKWASAK